jgi:hypothetical protein
LIAVARISQTGYGTRSQPAVRSRRPYMKTMATTTMSRTRISTRARSGRCIVKKNSDQSMLRISWIA